MFKDSAQSSVGAVLLLTLAFTVTDGSSTPAASPAGRAFSVVRHSCEEEMASRQASATEVAEAAVVIFSGRWQ